MTYRTKRKLQDLLHVFHSQILLQPTLSHHLVKLLVFVPFEQNGDQRPD